MASSSNQSHRAIRRCLCGTQIRTAWTDSNRGRRFYGCGNYKDGRRGCKYFKWVKDSTDYNSLSCEDGSVNFSSEDFQKLSDEIVSPGDENDHVKKIERGTS
ncbi:hypothetical protein ES332_A12G205800v1 [Gossypium tomentosum]|uniref:GRF-type domain-containing protein n=1 Tax=Gossypium tomentosum TaxID=34277 RepID=A0A5D2MZY5_GOSTO|nr:hypothetical protein ES332_A12G205800v1 [Gossypium tomentosum]TYH96848.1 hypothetical protein ES332_A12G205800v1 [Gossypium tomentosum]